MEMPPEPFLNVPRYTRFISGDQSLDAFVCPLQHRPGFAMPAAEIEHLIPEKLV